MIFQRGHLHQIPPMISLIAEDKNKAANYADDFIGIAKEIDINPDFEADLEFLLYDVYKEDLEDIDLDSLTISVDLD
ncbi:unnamed protein product [Gordionus sp. m RMFG-2023]